MKNIEPECRMIMRNIKRIKREKGITDEELALDVGISRSHFYYLKTERSFPTLNTLVKIAKSLDVSLIEIVGDASMSWRLKL